MYEVCPYGERRADMRAAVMTANTLTAQSATSVSAEEFRHIVKTLAAYLPANRDEELTIDSKAMREIPDVRGPSRTSES